MIQPLRTVHRRVFVTLAFALPAIMLASLAARRSPGRSLSSQLPDSFHVIATSSRLWHKHALTPVFYSDSAHPGEIDVVLTPAQEWNDPDLLLYWSAISSRGDSVPAAAQLLGAFVAHHPLTLPTNFAPGYLILFSVAHQSVFDTAQLEKLP